MRFKRVAIAVSNATNANVAHVAAQISAPASRTRVVNQCLSSANNNFSWQDTSCCAMLRVAGSFDSERRMFATDNDRLTSPVLGLFGIKTKDSISKATSKSPSLSRLIPTSISSPTTSTAAAKKFARQATHNAQQMQRNST